jgi:hypothetical protein
VGIGRVRQDFGGTLWNIIALPNMHGWQVFNFRQAIFSIGQAGVILTEKNVYIYIKTYA